MIDLKEAKIEFYNHLTRLKDLVAFVKRAATDIKDRKTIKANRAVREEEYQKEKARKEVENVIKKQQKDKDKQDEKARTKAKAQTKVATEDVAGYALVKM